jgi:hypothetical protein
MNVFCFVMTTLRFWHGSSYSWHGSFSSSKESPTPHRESYLWICVVLWWTQMEIMLKLVVSCVEKIIWSLHVKEVLICYVRKELT